MTSFKAALALLLMDTTWALGLCALTAARETSSSQNWHLTLNSTDDLDSDCFLTNILQRLALNIISLIYNTKWI